MSREIRIALCEDLEKDKNKLLNMITAYLDKNELVAEIDTYSSGEEFLKSDICRYSLVFFDIYMDKLNGMETAKKLIKENKSVQIVFCSTSRDFAAESYDVSALHYIIKPVEESKLTAVLNRFFDGVKKMKTISVKIGRKEEILFVNDIIYAESANKKTRLHTKNGILEVSMPFSFFCKELKEPDFVKPIRYALVAVNSISGVPNETITLSDKTVLPVSRGMRQHVRDVFAQYKWKMCFNSKGASL